jgi:uncharacterized protein YjbI with pentapeptide repeats
MIEAIPAPVRPRVRVVGSDNEAEPLQQVVACLLRTGVARVIQIVGPSGSGKTTALKHLGAVLPGEGDVVLLDEPDVQHLASEAHWSNRIVCTMQEPLWTCKDRRLVTLQLLPWTHDDLIEYLLAVHKSRCASVMARIRPQDHLYFGGLPDVWRIILDELAADAALPDAAAALLHHLEWQLPDTDLVERARSACLNALTPGKPSVAETFAKPGFPPSLVRLLRHETVQTWLAAQRIADDLCSDAACDFLARRLPRGVVKTAVTMLRDEPRAIERLQRLLDGSAWSHAMAASLMLAINSEWALLPPQRGCDTATISVNLDGKETRVSTAPGVTLAGAYLDHAKWAGISLVNADLEKADLEGATLLQADLSGTDVSQANLRNSCLIGANLDNLVALKADFSGSDMGPVQATRARFDGANLADANLADACLVGASFHSANLRGAQFCGAILKKATLTHATIKGADFTGANLAQVDLGGSRLRLARFVGACFVAAKLVNCDMEFMELGDADFHGAWLEGALLTGTTARAANFEDALLGNAKLADIDWEGVNLCDADLTGATFHLGSTRSGLVGSPLACEGSRTGFYTDDYEEQYFKSPEEIRKANLCGADLRGSKISGVDFYLVDLRGASYDSGQAAYFRSCKAIL